MKKQDKIIRIIFSVLFVAAVAALGSAFTDTSTEWYQNLTKPSLQPPSIVFPIVWTILYALLAVSLSLTATDETTDNSIYLLHLINGVLNVLWSYVFFQKQNPGSAIIVLILLIITAALLTAKVYRKNKTAGILLIPYVVWLMFALYLNYEIAFLN